MSILEDVEQRLAKWRMNKESAHDQETSDQVKPILDQMKSAAAEMNKLTSMQYREDGSSKTATEQILSQIKVVAGAVNKPTVNEGPTICTDPDRLKKLEQWRRQHSKTLYGSTAGGAK